MGVHMKMSAIVLVLFSLLMAGCQTYSSLYGASPNQSATYVPESAIIIGEELPSDLEEEPQSEEAKKLAKELLAYGFNPKKTFFIIDQVYTNIYNLAVKLSKKVNYSEIKATYGYKPEENIGLHFYPAVQSAHILFPQVAKGIKNVLVPIGPDEDAHIRI